MIRLVPVTLVVLLVACSAQAVPTVVTGTEPNTVALYTLNEFAGNTTLVSAGTNVMDSSPNGLTGKTGLATRTYQSTDLGAGFGNNLRADSKVYVPASILSSSLYQGDFTMEMWVRNSFFINSSGQITSESVLFSSSNSGGGIGWLFDIYKNGSGKNVLKVYNGSAWTDNAIADLVLPAGTGWSHWAAAFTNTNPGVEDSRYSVSLYITPVAASAPTLAGTFSFNPTKTATELSAMPLIFNGDLRSSGGKGFSVAQPGDLVDSLRVSNIARTSFESFTPEPVSASLLALAVVPLLRRRA